MTKENQKQDLKVYDDLKNCFRILGLPIEKEVTEGQFQHFNSEIRRGEYSMGIRTLYDPKNQTVIIGITFSQAVQPEKRGEVFELINRINQILDMNHFFMIPETGMIALRNGLFVTDNTLNTDQFHMFFKKLIGDGHTFYPAICEQVFSDLKPADLLAKFLLDRQDYWE